jgi:5-methylcytosine-specific restriction endonuclease McrA
MAIPKSAQWRFDMRAEMAVLEQRDALASERIAFLQKWAALKRRASKDYSTRRQAFQRGNPRGRTLRGVCWACSANTDVFTHHIVQLQNGGTNNPMNLVRVCGGCHSAVHPWM